MYIKAVLKPRGTQNPSDVLQTFFEKATPKKMSIDDEIITLEYFFDEKYLKVILETITRHEVIQLIYENDLDSCEPITSNESNEKHSLKNEDESKCEIEEKHEAEEKEAITPKISKNKIAKPEELAGKSEILEGFANESSSYEEFVEKVVEFLELGKKQNVMKAFIIAAENVSKINWRNIEEYVVNDGVFFNLYIKTRCTTQVAKKFATEKMSILDLLKKIVEYKNRNFSNSLNQAEEEEEDIFEGISEIPELPESLDTYKEEEKTDGVEEVKTSEDNTGMRVRMKCMPEIPEFEQFLAKVDKTKPVENRVRYVLTVMGLLDLPEELQDELVEVATVAVKLSEPNLDFIFIRANVELERVMEVRMKFAKFINDFIARFGFTTKVKLLEFLHDLQPVVMLQNEIDDFIFESIE